MEELGLSPQQFQEMLEQIQKFLREMEGDLSELTQAMLSGNRGELERLLREAVEQEVQNGSAESFRYTPFTRMAGRLQMDRVQSEIERFKGMLQMLGQNGEDLQKVMQYLDERMRDLHRLLRRFCNKSNASRAWSRATRASVAPWAIKAFLFTPKTISGA
jgi:hypothetical protein